MSIKKRKGETLVQYAARVYSTCYTLKPYYSDKYACMAEINGRRIVLPSEPLYVVVEVNEKAPLWAMHLLRDGNIFKQGDIPEHINTGCLCARVREYVLSKVYNKIWKERHEQLSIPF